MIYWNIKDLVLQSRQIENNATQIELSDVFDFVPDLVMALLMSVFTDEHQLHRVLSQDWLRTWKVWEEWDKSKRNEGSVDLSDDSFAEELVRRLVAISMDQAVTKYPSDAERRRELLMSFHLDVKQGDYIFSFTLGRFAQAVARWKRNGKAW